MSNVWQSLSIIGVVAAVTVALRALPFVFFRGRTPPKLLRDLGLLLPPAILAVLVVYCLKAVNVLTGSHGLPELIAIGVVVGLHLWRRNTLLSILGGTAVYMVLIQVVFR